MKRLECNTFELSPVEIRILEIVRDTIGEVEQVETDGMVGNHTKQDWNIIDSACEILRYYKSQNPKITFMERSEIFDEILDCI
jgi:hypothetical protein